MLSRRVDTKYGRDEYKVKAQRNIARKEVVAFLGGRLMEQVIQVATGGNFIQMVAVIGDSANLASINLHKSIGFEHVGVLKDVGFKHGRWLDTVLMQRTLL